MILGKCGPCYSVGTGVVVKSVEDKETGKYHNYVLTVEHILLDKLELRNEEGEVTTTIEPEYNIRKGKYEKWSKYTGHDQYIGTVVFSKDGVSEDVALMVFDTDHAVAVAKIYKSPELYIGNDVFRIGCGLGEPFRLDYGKITSLPESVDRIVDGTKHTFRISADTLPGDSGGPVYHEYKLIGITQTIRTIPGPIQNTPVCFMTYVIPLERYMKHKEIASIIG